MGSTDVNMNLFPILEPFAFETYYDGEEVIHHRREKWHLTIVYSVIYIATVFCLRSFMKDHKAYELRYALALWNLVMAVVSVFATVRMVPGYLHLVWDHSYAFSVCNNTYGLKIMANVFWGTMFSWLKVIEFGDTMFLVLRKRKLTFLHCYHHAMTAVMTDYSLGAQIPIGHGFMVANYIVHSFMYSYYALMSAGMKVPRAISMSLTSLQILQMVFGVMQCYFAFYYRATRTDCHLPLFPITFVIVVYFSYFLLFCYFFYSTYLSLPQKPRKID